MSQYLYSSVFKCLLFNVFIFVSFCDNTDHFRIVFYDNSTLAFDKYRDTNVTNVTNSTSFGQNSVNHRNHSIDANYLDTKSCLSIDNCYSYQICCPVGTYSSACIESTKCKAYIEADCNDTIPCQDEIGLECLPKTEWSSIDQRSCQCGDDYTYDYIEFQCVRNNNNYDSRTAMQIYKITMIFASCCLALILIIFLVCILRKSYCAPRPQQMVPLDNTTIPDIFTLFPHVGNYDGGPLADGTQPPFEKPPTYDETLTLIRNEIGVPPPAYRSRNGSNGSRSTNPSNTSSPQMPTRILISNPTLVTVEDLRHQDSRVQSSNDMLIAGPSTSPSDRGIDNLAFR